MEIKQISSNVYQPPTGLAGKIIKYVMHSCKSIIFSNRFATSHSPEDKKNLIEEKLHISKHAQFNLITVLL